MTAMGAQALSQFGLFDAELAEVRELLRDREEAYRRERQARFEANKSRLLADTGAWKGGEFSERVEDLLGKLLAAGEPAQGMHDAILSGINAAAKGGRLDERHVVFVEEKARAEVARVSTVDQAIPTSWVPRTAADLAKLDQGCAQLPAAIQQAALSRLNEYGPQLAHLGFKSEAEVGSHCPHNARQIADGMREVHTAVMLLAVNRYRHGKGYKTAKVEHLERMEMFASHVLGIDTQAHPGVKMDLPLTAGGVRHSRLRNSPKREQSHEAAAAASAPQHTLPSGIYVGKITALSDDTLQQKVGRDPRDVVVHDRRASGGDDAAVGTRSINRVLEPRPLSWQPMFPRRRTWERNDRRSGRSQAPTGGRSQA